MSPPTIKCIRVYNGTTQGTYDDYDLDDGISISKEFYTWFDNNIVTKLNTIQEIKGKVAIRFIDENNKFCHID